MRLSGVLGQGRAQAALNAEMAAGRLAHAYLLVGPAGAGRATLARALFMALVCQGGGEEACGVCGPCRRAAAWQHEDLLVLAPPSDQASAQIKVEEVREALRRLSFSPSGPWRLVLIREAGHLNPASGNALLKVLEEPPPGNILALTVQDAGEVLPTLVSRCRRVNLAPLAEDEIAAELARRGVEPERARVRAALAGGSLGRALELDEGRLLAELERLREAIAAGGGPLADWAFADQLVAGFRGSGRIDREGICQVLDLWSLYLRDMAVAAAGRPQAAVLPGPAGEPLPVARATEAFARVRRAQGLILGNAQPELAITVLMGELRAALA